MGLMDSSSTFVAIINESVGLTRQCKDLSDQLSQQDPKSGRVDPTIHETVTGLQATSGAWCLITECCYYWQDDDSRLLQLLQSHLLNGKAVLSTLEEDISIIASQVKSNVFALFLRTRQPDVISKLHSNHFREYQAVLRRLLEAPRQ